jgi:hypothetical protein
MIVIPAKAGIHFPQVTPCEWVPDRVRDDI